MAAIMLAHVKVEDYDRWRATFESHMETRKNGGCLGTHIFYNAKDKKEIIINFQWDSEENAQKWMSSDEARQAMADAGLIGSPEVWFLEDGGRTAS